MKQSLILKPTFQRQYEGTNCPERNEKTNLTGNKIRGGQIEVTNHPGLPRTGEFQTKTRTSQGNQDGQSPRR